MPASQDGDQLGNHSHTQRTDPADLSTSDTEDLLDTMRHWAITRDTLQTLTGRLAAELHTRGWSIRDIADHTGFAKSSLDRWAAPYTRGGEDQ